MPDVSKTTDELQLRWAPENPVMLFENMKLPQFEIENVTVSLCKEKFHIGEYSCLKAEFYLQRSLGYHMVQSYLPTILIVVISWVSFWLDVDAIPARVTLGVTTLLTISSKGAGIQSNLPPVSYVKAMDVWMGMCTSFVFSALLEFTVVNYLWRHNSASHCIVLHNLVQAAAKGGGAESVIARSREWNSKLRAKRIDRASRVGFPACFIVFNILYWPYYMRQ
ncbi:glycine receptor subunit alpha-2-like [Tropilaelaps mercedesae]|uniref:Glycine receptor subunit alpha-2-like n=1 Tax=Tropilaelaps mercedesae TaxID=418985 RepID=A0A1V9X879_9ACAR|nr:glycine receptor subunit alpha-2-like [Tropilaelaps mercedesae]